MGVPKLAAMLGIDTDYAQELMDRYNTNAPEIKALFNLAWRRAGARKMIRSWGQRIRRFPILKDKKGRSFDQTRSALNALLQGSAADLMKMAMIRVSRIIEGTPAQLHLTVHDELDLSIPCGAEGDKIVLAIRDAMEDFCTKRAVKEFNLPRPLSVPIKVDIEEGSNWGKWSKLNKEGLVKWNESRSKKARTA
jgi:DNA polymerase-1